jgi:hypothetical protein
MMLSEDRLYGWGAGNTIMPRAAIVPHAKGQRRTGKIPYLGRQGGAVFRWRSAGIFRLFVDDYPWGQFFSFCILAPAILACIFLINRTLPIDQDEQLARPVEIIIALHEEEHQEIKYSSENRLLPEVEHKQREGKVVRKPVTEKSQQDVLAQAKPEKQVKTENIVISPPVFRQRKYGGAESTTIPPASQSRDTTEIISPENKKSTLAFLQSDRLQRKYRNDKQNNKNFESFQKVDSTELYAAARLEDTGGLTSPRADWASHSHASLEKSSHLPAQTPPQSLNQEILFGSQKRAKIPEPELGKQARSFDKQSPATRHPSQGISGAAKFPTLQQKVEFPGAVLPATGQSEERYVFEENHRDQAPVPQSVKQELSFHSQKGKENPELDPPVSTSFFSGEPRSVEKGSSSLIQVPDFSQGEVADEINPADLISLKEFSVCKDPEREFHLKTQLAVCLHGPSRIEAAGVLYFFKNTESGYTLQIDIYNPQGRSFKDRCEVLELAINSLLKGIK